MVISCYFESFDVLFKDNSKNKDVGKFFKKEKDLVSKLGVK